MYAAGLRAGSQTHHYDPGVSVYNKKRNLDEAIEKYTLHVSLQWTIKQDAVDALDDGLAGEILEETGKRSAKPIHRILVGTHPKAQTPKQSEKYH
ncbi:hypothetical protein HDU86_001934, partial [Geranomyces michiganensis]